MSDSCSVTAPLDVIYLSPKCADKCEILWCEDDNGPCEDCGAAWTRYVLDEKVAAESLALMRMRYNDSMVMKAKEERINRLDREVLLLKALLRESAGELDGVLNVDLLIKIDAALPGTIGA